MWSPGADTAIGVGIGPNPPPVGLPSQGGSGVRVGNPAPLPIPDVSTRSPGPPICGAPTRSSGPPFGLGYREAARTVAHGVSVVGNELSAVGVFGGQVRKQNPTRSARVGAAVVASVRYGDIPGSGARTIPGTWLLPSATGTSPWPPLRPRLPTRCADRYGVPCRVGVCPSVWRGNPGAHPGLFPPGGAGLVVTVRLGEKLFVTLLGRAVDDGCVYESIGCATFSSANTGPCRFTCTVPRASAARYQREGQRRGTCFCSCFGLLSVG